MVYPWQQSQWQQLQQALAGDRLHHAMLLYGQAGTGKKQFAGALAHALLCAAPQQGQACGHCGPCQLLAAGTHPDFISIRPLPPKDTRSANPVLSIRIEVIRELCERLATTSQLDGYRIAVIEDADKMGHAAANSLLKTLEEPGGDTLLILVSSQPQRLPATIRSRCQQVAFPVPPRELATQWLQQQDIGDSEELLLHCHGAPLLAAAEQQAGETRALLGQALVARAAGQPSLQFAAQLAKQPRNPALLLLLDWLADLVRIKTDSGTTLYNAHHRQALAAISQNADWKRIYGLYDEVCRLIRYDAIALNNELLWENLLISWDRL